MQHDGVRVPPCEFLEQRLTVRVRGTWLEPDLPEAQCLGQLERLVGDRGRRDDGERPLAGVPLRAAARQQIRQRAHARLPQDLGLFLEVVYVCVCACACRGGIEEERGER